MLTTIQTTEIENLLKNVGVFQLKNQQKVTQKEVDEKSLNQLVSYVDIESEKKLIIALRSITPEAVYMAEENSAEHVSGELQWIIDPLDGTTNYLYGHSKYAISIALLYRGTAVYSAVYAPADEELYVATPQGAWLNGTKINVSTRTTLASSLIATGFPYYTFGEIDQYIATLAPLMKETKGIRRMGSAALDLVYTACGRFDAFYELNLSPWDVAAGAYIVQQAGGVVTDFQLGNNYIFGNSILASNGLLHTSMVTILRDAGL